MSRRRYKRRNPSERRFTAGVWQIKDAAKAQGSHFFDPGTMRFFRSRVGDKTYMGRYFITSEKGPHGGRRYTVRKATVQGGRLMFGGIGKSKHGPSGFQKFRSRAAAVAHIKKMERKAIGIAAARMARRGNPLAHPRMKIRGKKRRVRRFRRGVRAIHYAFGRQYPEAAMLKLGFTRQDRRRPKARKNPLTKSEATRLLRAARRHLHTSRAYLYSDPNFSALNAGSARGLADAVGLTRFSRGVSEKKRVQIGRIAARAYRDAQSLDQFAHFQASRRPGPRGLVIDERTGGEIRAVRRGKWKGAGAGG